MRKSLILGVCAQDLMEKEYVWYCMVRGAGLSY